MRERSAAAISKSKQFFWQCENLTFQQGITAATDKAISGVRRFAASNRSSTTASPNRRRVLRDVLTDPASMSPAQLYSLFAAEGAKRFPGTLDSG